MSINIVIILLIVCIFGTMYNKYETFDKTNRIFEPLGQPRYGLRGEKLNTQAIDDCYYDHYKCYTNTFMNNPKTARYYGHIYDCGGIDSELRLPPKQL